MARVLRAVGRAGLRAAVGAVVAVGVVALIRAAVGRTSGTPGLPARRGTPMSFDSWPPVPHAPAQPRA